MDVCTPIPSEMLAFELNADNTLEGLPLLLKYSTIFFRTLSQIGKASAHLYSCNTLPL